MPVPARVAKAIREAAIEHCGWTPSLKLCAVLYDAAAPLIAAAERDRNDDAIADARYEGRMDGERVGAAAERDRIRQLADERHAMYREFIKDPDLAFDGFADRPFADLLRGDQP